MAKRFRGCSLGQAYLLPPSLQDWLPESHLARFVADLVSELDLSAVLSGYTRKNGRGMAAYHPEMLVRVLLYAYCTGQPSSRKIEQATYTDLAFRFLCANQHPDHDTIAAFRQRHLTALADLFVQVLRLCQKAGLVKLGHVAIDGTKIKANARRSRSVPYQRLCERETYWQEMVAKLLQQAARTDQTEARQPVSEPLPPTLAYAETRLAAIRGARQALDREAQQKLAQAQSAHTPGTAKRGRPLKDAPPVSELDKVSRKRRKRAYYRAVHEAQQPTASFNFTDPDSRLMLDGSTGIIVQAYNAQAAVDETAQIIVACEVTSEGNDKRQLAPMATRVAANTGQQPELVTADCGYWDTGPSASCSSKDRRCSCHPSGGPKRLRLLRKARLRRRCEYVWRARKARRNMASVKARSSRCSATLNSSAATASLPCAEPKRCAPNGRYCV